ncbi:hypothetical protein BJY04DRAFT_213367 [Aspergillus karnatakaensis]|uniref:uncharacterized protein n=1 Tax=Aspergillus karnatakaensis TaxID=1810916 RepID=UPI003CCDB50F
MKLHLVTLLATLAATSSAAAIEKRAGTCSFLLRSARSQNPVVGGDNTLLCYGEVTYADGSTEKLSTACNEVSHDKCYFSQLPYSICIHTNPSNTDGYLDYSDQHADFNSDACEKSKGASISGDWTETTCSFAC